MKDILFYFAGASRVVHGYIGQHQRQGFTKVVLPYSMKLNALHAHYSLHVITISLDYALHYI